MIVKLDHFPGAKKYLKPHLMGKVSNKQQELVGGFNPFEKY